MYKKKALVLTILFGANTFINLLSQIVIANFYGAGLVLDSFLIAVTLPTILITIFYASINDSFLPEYVKHYKKSVKNSALFAGSWLLHLLIIGIVISFILLLNAGFIMYFIFQTNDPLASHYLKIFSLAIPISLTNALLMSIAYSHKKFYLPVIVQVLGACANITVIMQTIKIAPIYSLVFGFLANVTLQCIILIPILKHIALTTKLSISKKLYSLWIPLIIMSFAFRADIWILRLASVNLAVGVVSIVNYSARIFSLSTGIITSGIRVLLLPRLSQSYAKRNIQKTKDIIRKSHISGMFLTMGFTVLIIIFRKYFIRIFFERGMFTSDISSSVIELLPYFIPAALGWGLFQLFATPYYIVGKQKIPTVISLFGLIIGYFIAVIFRNSFGIYTAPIAIGSMLLFNTIVTGSIWYLKEDEFFKQN